MLKINYKKEKMTGQMVQVPATLNGKHLMIRLKAGCSHFDFLWSSMPLTEEQKEQACDGMTHWYWG